MSSIKAISEVFWTKSPDTLIFQRKVDESGCHTLIIIRSVWRCKVKRLKITVGEEISTFRIGSFGLIQLEIFQKDKRLRGSFVKGSDRIYRLFIKLNNNKNSCINSR